MIVLVKSDETFFVLYYNTAFSITVESVIFIFRFSAIGIDSTVPSTQNGHFVREAESFVTVAILLNISGEIHEAHQKHA
jgi:hypothetical protein